MVGHALQSDRPGISTKSPEETSQEERRRGKKNGRYESINEGLLGESDESPPPPHNTANFEIFRWHGISAN